MGVIIILIVIDIPEHLSTPNPTALHEVIANSIGADLLLV